MILKQMNDPKRLGVIGDAAVCPLLDIWNGPTRKEWIFREKEIKSLCAVIVISGGVSTGVEDWMIGVTTNYRMWVCSSLQHPLYVVCPYDFHDE